MSNALIIVDVQNDFLPGGALGVPDGDKIIEPLIKLNEDRKRYDYDLILSSYDWHPKNHMSFVENGGPWPAHCVQNTHGAVIEERIADFSDYWIEKGGNPEKEAYSAFDGFVYNDTDGWKSKKPLLVDFLLDRHIEMVDVCGLALDYCVLATAMSAKREQFFTSVLLDLTRPVDYLTGARAIETLAAHDIQLDTTVYT